MRTKTPIKKPIFVKIGYSGYDSGKIVLLVIDPLRGSMNARRGKEIAMFKGSMNARRGKEIAMFREVHESAEGERDCNV